MTHFVPYDADPINRYGDRRAACGELVGRRDASPTPECRTCAAVAAAPPLLSAEPHPPAPEETEIHPPAPEEPELDAPEPPDETPPMALADVARSLGLQVVAAPEMVAVTSLAQAAATLKLVEESQDVIVKADRLQVVDTDTCQLGEDLFDILRSFEKAIEAHFNPHCERAHKTWKGLTDERALHLKPIEEARARLGTRVASWKSAQQERERAEQRQREQAAADEQRAAAERAAKQAVAQGDVAGAVEILAEARVAGPPVVPAPPSALPNTGKTSLRESWQAIRTDPPAFLKAIGDRTITEFDDVILDAVQGAMNAQARVLKGELGKRYPGWEGRKKPGLAGR